MHASQHWEITATQKQIDNISYDRVLFDDKNEWWVLLHVTLDEP